MKKERKLIGVCGARVFEQNFLSFINAVREKGLERGYATIAFSTKTDNPEDDAQTIGEQQLFKLCNYLDFHCLIIMAEGIKNQTLIQQVIDIGHCRNIPVFVLDGYVNGCYNLVMDYVSGFEKLVRHVVEEHGCRRVNMLAGNKGNSFSEERIDIYKKVLDENGIPFEEERLKYGDFWDRPARAAVKAFLDSNLPLPEAIVCANDAMALVACEVLKDAGIRVPEDILVTGFDGIQSGKYHTPMLTTCEPEYQDAMDFVFDEIEQAEKTGVTNPCDCKIKFTLRRNQSCGCKPNNFPDRNKMVSTLFSDLGDCAWHNTAMNQMLTEILHCRKIMDLAKTLPDTVRLWSDHYHFACVKTELLQSDDVPEGYSRMTTILRGDGSGFEEPGEEFDVHQVMPRLKELLREDGDADVLVIELLNYGKIVYGYSVEGFHTLEERPMQRCNEFAMSLANALNTVLHNNKLYRVNESLTEAYREISEMYIRDALTGIYNRRGFYKKLEDILKNSEGEMLNIVSIDMDRLKYINDNFGHAEGDFAIFTTAEAIRQVAGRNAVCARFGGDEFVCAVISQREAVDVIQTEWSQKLNETIRGMEGVSEKPYPIGASVGVSQCLVTEGMNTEVLIQSADRKMYENKAARKQERQE